jgi:phosphoribosylamine--glycine ligase
MKKAGLSVIPSFEFHDYTEAIDFVKANPKRYVSKPSGDADKALSYVSKSPADMVFMLQRWKETGKRRDFHSTRVCSRYRIWSRHLGRP